MEKKAIDAAVIAANRGRAALAAMEKSANFSELELAWSDFLFAAHRIYTKLEQGAKANGPSRAWFGRKKHERKADTLLCYIHHARNVDEHGLAEITEKKPGGIALGVGPGAWRLDGTIGPGGTMTVTALGGQVPGVSKFAEIIPAKIIMVPVVDRGDKYDPPKALDGSDMPPTDAAKLAFGQLERIIEEAEKLAV
jgi:hypothetical protein